MLLDTQYLSKRIKPIVSKLAMHTGETTTHVISARLLPNVLGWKMNEKNLNANRNNAQRQIVTISSGSHPLSVLTNLR
jgi:hypothetical protein